ncbi:short-chain dehydrogenase [Serendipita vermifera]|nr:short-chain dehydrogenase [Serendipita vermifera]
MDNSTSSKPVILVTGASRGLGLAVVTILLKERDARVVALSRKSNDALVSLAADHQQNLIVILGDIVDPQVSQRAVESALQQYGRLDGIILNAGVLEPTGTIATIPVDSPAAVASWKSLFDVNFFALIHTIQASLPALRKPISGKGKVIMVSSGAAVKGNYGWAPYSASKAAMNSLARTLAVEEKEVITVALRPGMVDTDMQGSIRSSTSLPPSEVQVFKDAHDSGKLVNPADAGFVIASLALSAHEKLSGQFMGIQKSVMPVSVFGMQRQMSIWRMLVLSPSKSLKA